MIRFPNAILPVIVAVLTVVPVADAADYHVDSAGGNDAAAGLGPDTAWRSLEKANAALLGPADRLLFKSGGRWSGQLKPKGSGKPGAIIHVGSYGQGAPPRIDGEGKHADAVLLENIPHIEVCGLEITNQGPARAPWRTGVRISANGIGSMANVRLSGLHVHDVNGDLRKSHEGCGIFFEAMGGKDSHFDGLIIEKCRVERTDRNGICQRGTGRTHSRNVIIRGNVLEDIGGDGIKLWGTDGGIIERNIVRKSRARCNDKEAAAGIWPFACDDTLIQFNEVSGTLGTLDGQGFDSDYWCRRSVFQYNYSHGNEGGFMLICSPGDAVNEDTVIRYNLSVHDGVNSARVFHFGGGAKGTHVYNNTVIIGPHQDLPLLRFTEWNRGIANATTFTNNLFIVQAGGRATYQLKPGEGHVFANNLFIGRHEGLPAGTAAADAIPRFHGELNPVPGSKALAAFRPLGAASFPRGLVITKNGGRDLMGVPLPANQPPAIGAFEPLP